MKAKRFETLKHIVAVLTSCILVLVLLGLLIDTWIQDKRCEQILEQFSPHVTRWITDHLPDRSAALHQQGWRRRHRRAVIVDVENQKLSGYYVEAASSIFPPSVLECEDPDKVETLVFIQHCPVFLGNYTGGIFISSPRPEDNLYSLYRERGKLLPLYSDTTLVSVVDMRSGKLLEVRQSNPDVIPKYIDQFIRMPGESESYMVEAHSGKTRYDGYGSVEVEGEHIGLHIMFDDQDDSALDWLEQVFLKDE